MSHNPEGGEEHPHPTHHQAVQGEAPLQGGKAGTFKDNGYSVLCGGVPAVGGRGEGLWEEREGRWTVSGMLMTSRYFGPSGVRALPLAAGINVVGHYKWHFFFSLSLSLRAHC